MPEQPKANVFYAQSGGVTSVINASAAGLIEAARAAAVQGKIGKVFAGQDGILGALGEDLLDTSALSDTEVAALRHTPGGAFGSCRYKLNDLTTHRRQYQRLVDVFRAHDIGYFFYNGGNDSMDTANKVATMAKSMDYPLVCVGIPKTVDNDLPHTDCCPGFGSVAKYVATSMREVGLDLASMARTSTKLFVMEVMGRHAGWITAACGLAAESPGQAPQILLFPEIAYDQRAVAALAKQAVERDGYCAIAVSEGLSDSEGRLIADMGSQDAFGHAQLGGVGQIVADHLKQALGYKYHWALVDYLQRSARHLASKTDLDQAYALGREALATALAGHTAVMMCVVRDSDSPYRWHIDHVPLDRVANVERKMPSDFIDPSGYHITDACRRYLSPLIEGEAPPPFKNGLPDYVRIPKVLTPKLLSHFEL